MGSRPLSREHHHQLLLSQELGEESCRVGPRILRRDIGSLQMSVLRLALHVSGRKLEIGPTNTAGVKSHC